MATNDFFKSSLYRLNDVVQSSASLYMKELIVAQLRDFFSRDFYYRFNFDNWGFPQTPDLTDVPLDAGTTNNVTTRLFIGENYRYNVIYYPSIVVKSGGLSYMPISFNRELGGIKWGDQVYEDGYGNIKIFKVPEAFIFAGAWEGSMNIDVRARDLRTRDDLIDLIKLEFVDIAFEDLKKSGMVVKGVSESAPIEMDDRNDKLFTQTVTLQVRGEWRRHIPIANIIDVINFSIEFGTLGPPPGPIDPNFTIHISETLADVVAKL